MKAPSDALALPFVAMPNLASSCPALFRNVMPRRLVMPLTLLAGHVSEVLPDGPDSQERCAEEHRQASVQQQKAVPKKPSCVRSGKLMEPAVAVASA